MLEIAVEFLVRLLFPNDDFATKSKSKEATVTNYTFSSVFPIKLEDLHENP